MILNHFNLEISQDIFRPNKLRPYIPLFNQYTAHLFDTIPDYSLQELPEKWNLDEVLFLLRQKEPKDNIDHPRVFSIFEKYFKKELTYLEQTLDLFRFIAEGQGFDWPNRPISSQKLSDYSINLLERHDRIVEDTSRKIEEFYQLLNETFDMPTILKNEARRRSFTPDIEGYLKEVQFYRKLNLSRKLFQ